MNPLSKLLLLISLMSIPTLAILSGSGTELDPYQIASYEDLKEVSSNDSAHYQLTADIDAAASYGEGGFEPIESFYGIFDGQFFTIKNLYINKPSSTYVGFISYLAEGELKNLYIHGDVTGSLYTGVAVGFCDGLISNLVVSGNVTGNGFCGGITGRLRGTLEKSITTVNVFSSESAGGIVGHTHSGTMKNSYFAGKVKVKDGVAAGIAYYCYGSSMFNIMSIGKSGNGLTTSSVGQTKNSYWNPEISGATSSASGESLTSSEMTQDINFVEWDFSTVWKRPLDGPFPNLRGLNNPPVAFDDTLTSMEDMSDTALILANDYDATSTSTLVIKIEDESTLNSTKDTVNVNYQVVEVTADNDTLWGGFATLTIPVTFSDTLEISSYSDLKKIGHHILYPLSLTYILTQDIDASASMVENVGAGFEPIGSSLEEFTGTFDGQGFTISNLTINRGNEDNVGLFGNTGISSSVKNLNVSGSVTGKNRVGLLVGENGGDVTNCSSAGTVIGSRGASVVGGLIGFVNGYVDSSFSDATVSSSEGDEIGGFAGYIQYGAPITNCYATGSVTGLNKVGGLVGTLGSLTSIIDCYSTGAVTGMSAVGGLVGHNEGGVVRSFSTGSVTGHIVVGGTVGDNPSGEIENSYSTGSVSGSESVGGFVGRHNSEIGGATISNSYSVGAVSGSSKVGGFIGDTITGVIPLVSCYWDVVSSGQSSSAGGASKLTSEMKTSATFTGWTMPTTWCMDDGEEYPLLRWSASEIRYTYYENSDGIVSGDTLQYVAKNSNYGISSLITNPVTAIANKEHAFKMWSDKNDNLVRNDSGLIGDTLFWPIFGYLELLYDTTNTIVKDTVLSVDSVYSSNSDTLVTTISSENWINSQFVRTDTLIDCQNFGFKVDSTFTTGSNVLSAVVDTLKYHPTITVSHDRTHSISKQGFMMLDSVYDVETDTIVTTIITENWIDTMFTRTDSLSDDVSYWFTVDTSVTNGSDVISTVIDTLKYMPTITVTHDTTHSIVKDTVAVFDSVYSVGSDTVVTTSKTENWIDTMFARTDSLSDGVSYWFSADTTITDGSNVISTVFDTLMYIPTITVTDDTTHSIAKDTVIVIDSVYSSGSDTVVTTIKTENWADTMFARTDSLSDGISYWFNIDTTITNGTQMLSTTVDTLNYISALTVTHDTTHSIMKDTVVSVDSVAQVNGDTVVTTVSSENWIDTMFARTDSLSDGVSYWHLTDTTITTGSDHLGTTADSLWAAVAVLDGGAYKGEVEDMAIAPNPAGSSDCEVNIVVNGTSGASVRITIYDNLGNLIDKQNEDIYVNGTHRFIWDLTNRYGVSVGSGSYVAIALVTHSDGTCEMFKKMIGVQR